MTPQQPLGNKVHQDDVVREQVKLFFKKLHIFNAVSIDRSRTREVEKIITRQLEHHLPPRSLRLLHPTSRNRKRSPFYHRSHSPRPQPAPTTHRCSSPPQHALLWRASLEIGDREAAAPSLRVRCGCVYCFPLSWQVVLFLGIFCCTILRRSVFWTLT